jgi:uncharacterized protein (TIGR02246 family)
MEARTPEDVAEAFAAALTRRDLDGALSMWSEQAAIVTADGSLVEGRAAIREALQALLSNGTTVRIEVARLFEAGDVALATGWLTLSGEGYEHRSDSTVVYARDPDGHWRIALDAPWGLPQS